MKLVKRELDKVQGHRPSDGLLNSKINLLEAQISAVKETAELATQEMRENFEKMVAD